MNKTALNVLVYLLGRSSTTAMGADVPKGPLESRPDIPASFEALDVSALKSWVISGNRSSPYFRVFSKEENFRLETDARGLLLELVRNRILDPAQLELVMDCVFALDEDGHSIDNLKWVVLMVLFTTRGEDSVDPRMALLFHGALSRMSH